jgi:hypothetical protein
MTCSGHGNHNSDYRDYDRLFQTEPGASKIDRICIVAGGDAAYGAALVLTWLFWLLGDQSTRFYDVLPFVEALVLFVSLPLAWKVGIIGSAFVLQQKSNQIEGARFRFRTR